MNPTDLKEYCEKNDINLEMAICNCPYPKDENGITIFPKKISSESLEDETTIKALMDHIATMTNQLNALTMEFEKLKSN
jgi:hypothetical protein